MVEHIIYMRPNIVEDLNRASTGKRLNAAQRKLMVEAAAEITELRQFIATNGRAWSRIMDEIAKSV